MSCVKLTRRQMMAALSIGAFAPASPGFDETVVRQHDESVALLLEKQVSRSASANRGGYPDEFGLHHPGSGSSCLLSFLAAWLCPQSRYHQQSELVERMRWAAGFLDRCQNSQGNVSLLTTNFNSPPDTAFVTHSVAAAGRLARLYNKPQIFPMVEPWLRKAGGALAVGGVHTPNHRWVVCEALAAIHELLPDSRYVRRIDQWLAEGVDIDEDGQFNERSTTVYNPVTDRALAVLAHKGKRPELLELVRRNLDSMLYLLHPGGEVVTEISRRQDQYARGDMSRYWFPLRYLAARDRNGRYAALVRQLEPRAASLPLLMEYPELRAALPASAPLPENYEKEFPASRVVRIRRGLTSATVLLNGSSRFLTLRRGEAVVEAVRFASAFFGKGQFSPERFEKRAGIWTMSQSLEGPYYQPLVPARKVGADEWAAVRPLRSRTEVCRMEYRACVRERHGGFSIEIVADGVEGVPLAIEVGLRPGGSLDGCVPAPEVGDGWLLKHGMAVYRYGRDTLRFGPGLGDHAYTQIRGAEPRLPGTSVYLCGYTPFRHTVDFALDQA